MKFDMDRQRKIQHEETYTATKMLFIDETYKKYRNIL